MPRPATVPIDDAELKMQEPASPEEMEHRRVVASRLRSLMNRPIAEAEKEFWQEFDTGLAKERLELR